MVQAPPSGGMPASASAETRHQAARQRKLGAEAHAAQIEAVRAAVRDAGDEEKCCLEGRMGDQMQHRDPRPARAHGGEHQAELRRGGAGEHLLGVQLDQRNIAAGERGEQADGDGGGGEPRRARERGVQPHDQERTRRDHRRGMQIGRDRGGAGHGAEQPGGRERHLSGF